MARLPFLSEEVLSRVRRVDGSPVLRDGMESSAPRLHVAGAAAAGTFGPAMRFVTGGADAARTLTRRALGKIPSPLTSSS